jgi:hypothetical protein
MAVRRWHLGCCVVFLLAASGCTNGSAASPVAGSDPSGTSAEPNASSQQASGSPEDGGPLVALPSCQPPPPGIDADVPGLVLPDGAVVTEVEEQGPLISVRAYVEQTPIQVRRFYQRTKGLELQEIEDEVYEAEALFSGSEFNTYVKAQAQCRQGSVLIVFVGPGESGDLPSVGG